MKLELKDEFFEKCFVGKSDYKPIKEICPFESARATSFKVFTLFMTKRT
jgi:hypothetical protein